MLFFQTRQQDRGNFLWGEKVPMSFLSYQMDCRILPDRWARTLDQRKPLQIWRERYTPRCPWSLSQSVSRLGTPSQQLCPHLKEMSSQLCTKTPNTAWRYLSQSQAALWTYPSTNSQIYLYDKLSLFSGCQHRTQGCPAAQRPQRNIPTHCHLQALKTNQRKFFHRICKLGVSDDNFSGDLLQVFLWHQLRTTAPCESNPLHHFPMSLDSTRCGAQVKPKGKLQALFQKDFFELMKKFLTSIVFFCCKRHHCEVLSSCVCHARIQLHQIRLYLRDHLHAGKTVSTLQQYQTWCQNNTSDTFKIPRNQTECPCSLKLQACTQKAHTKCSAPDWPAVKGTPMWTQQHGVNSYLNTSQFG